MTSRVLFVDDEPMILDGIRRLLHKDYDVEVAVGGQAALSRLDDDHQFEVVVSDMMMPDMNGPEFLSHVAQAHPGLVQMILSGQADLSSTVAAVNNGQLFRFLLKPIERDSLTAAIEAALEQSRLRRVEKDFFDETLTGAMSIVADALDVASLDGLRRAAVVRDFVDRMTAATELRDDWQLKVAVVLANVALFALPADVLRRSFENDSLSDLEKQMLSNHPVVAADLIGAIPRLEPIAEIVRAQCSDDVSEVRDQLLAHTDVLRLANELADRTLQGWPEETAISDIGASRDFPVAFLAGLRNGSGQQ